jgi:hypothetical protein
MEINVHREYAASTLPYFPYTCTPMDINLSLSMQLYSQIRKISILPQDRMAWSKKSSHVTFPLKARERGGRYPPPKKKKKSEKFRS